MENKEVSTEETVPANGVIDQEKIDRLTAEYESLKKENAEKVYGLPVKDETVRQLFIDFIDNDVEWKYMESFGIPKIHAALMREDIKNGKIYLKGIEVEALSFYLMKAHGKGRKSAERFLKMKESVDEVYKIREADNRKENNLLHSVEALKQGINVSGAEETETE